MRAGVDAGLTQSVISLSFNDLPYFTKNHECDLFLVLICYIYGMIRKEKQVTAIKRLDISFEMPNHWLVSCVNIIYI